MVPNLIISITLSSLQSWHFITLLVIEFFKHFDLFLELGFIDVFVVVQACSQVWHFIFVFRVDTVESPDELGVVVLFCQLAEVLVVLDCFRGVFLDCLQGLEVWDAVIVELWHFGLEVEVVVVQLLQQLFELLVLAGRSLVFLGFLQDRRCICVGLVIDVDVIQLLHLLTLLLTVLLKVCIWIALPQDRLFLLIIILVAQQFEDVPLSHCVIVEVVSVAFLPVDVNALTGLELVGVLHVAFILHELLRRVLFIFLFLFLNALQLLDILFLFPLGVTVDFRV